MKKTLPNNAILIPDNAKLVFKGKIFDVYQWPQKMYDGSSSTFEMLKRPDSVEIIPIIDDNIIVTEEEQPDSPDSFYATPGGRHDVEGETTLQAAKRELLEETGMKFKNWKLIQVFQPAPKIEHFVYRFIATDFESQTDQELDSGEKIKILKLNLQEVKKLCDSPRAKYLQKDIFSQVNSINDLLNLPEFVGQEVDR